MSWYQTFWDALADAHERAQHDPAVWRTPPLKRWVIRISYLTIGHFFCFFTYFLPGSAGRRMAGRLTCHRFLFSDESFRRHRIRAIGASVIVMSVLSTGGISAITDRVLSLLDPNFRLQTNEFFDGYDTEVFVSGFGKSIQTDNSVEDQSVHSHGAVATWQRLTQQGWEIFFWTPLDPYPAQLTNDGTDDISPKTDGTLIAWQKKQEGVWRVYVANIEGTVEIREVSLGGNASDVQIDSGAVVWQEWVNGRWEIMLYKNGSGTIQLSGNGKSAVSPVVVSDSVFWEGVDPVEGDKEIYRYHLDTGEVENVTNNQFHDDSPTLDGDRVLWYERRPDVSLKIWFDARLDWKSTQPLPELPKPIVPVEEEGREDLEEGQQEEGVEDAEQEAVEEVEVSEEVEGSEYVEESGESEEDTQEAEGEVVSEQASVEEETISDSIEEGEEDSSLSL